MLSLVFFSVLGSQAMQLWNPRSAGTAESISGTISLTFPQRLYPPLPKLQGSHRLGQWFTRAIWPEGSDIESWELLIASFTSNLFMFKVFNYLLIFSITFYVFLAVSVALLISFYTFAGFPPRWSPCSSLMMLPALLGDLCAQEPTMVWRFLWSHSVEGLPINLVNDGQHNRAISQIWRHAEMYNIF